MLNIINYSELCYFISNLYPLSPCGMFCFQPKALHTCNRFHIHAV